MKRKIAVVFLFALCVLVNISVPGKAEAKAKSFSKIKDAKVKEYVDGENLFSSKYYCSKVKGKKINFLIRTKSNYQYYVFGIKIKNKEYISFINNLCSWNGILGKGSKLEIPKKIKKSNKKYKIYIGKLNPLIYQSKDYNKYNENNSYNSKTVFDNSIKCYNENDYSVEGVRNGARKVISFELLDINEYNYETMGPIPINYNECTNILKVNFENGESCYYQACNYDSELKFGSIISNTDNSTYSFKYDNNFSFSTLHFGLQKIDKSLNDWQNDVIHELQKMENERIRTFSSEDKYDNFGCYKISDSNRYFDSYYFKYENVKNYYNTPTEKTDLKIAYEYNSKNLYWGINTNENLNFIINYPKLLEKVTTNKTKENLNYLINTGKIKNKIKLKGKQGKIYFGKAYIGGILDSKKVSGLVVNIGLN